VSEFAFRLQSFAKINVSLRILGRRPDGYHEIHTILQTVSLHDDLLFACEPDGQIILSCSEPRIPINENNLVVRAANALRDRFGVKGGASIHLEKRIPAKGGLGGASSNAAMTLFGLTRLWNIDANKSGLIELAARLGADVPFFLTGGCAVATGIGTHVSSLPDVPHKHLLIVTPNATVSTADAYQSFKAPSLTTSGDASILSGSRAEADSEVSDPWRLHNDFEEPIFELEPEIARAKRALIDVGAGGSLLAGSGSSVFGIFDNLQAQQQALKTIKAEVGWRIFPVVTLSRDEYVQALGSCAVPLSRSDTLKSDTGA
jgi:4-diphosphocytidyl-2-C-methyl-D-erythritol kinase